MIRVYQVPPQMNRDHYQHIQLYADPPIPAQEVIPGTCACGGKTRVALTARIKFMNPPKYVTVGCCLDCFENFAYVGGAIYSAQCCNCQTKMDVEGKDDCPKCGRYW